MPHDFKSQSNTKHAEKEKKRSTTQDSFPWSVSFTASAHRSVRPLARLKDLSLRVAAPSMQMRASLARAMKKGRLFRQRNNTLFFRVPLSLLPLVNPGACGRGGCGFRLPRLNRRRREVESDLSGERVRASFATFLLLIMRRGMSCAALWSCRNRLAE